MEQKGSLLRIEVIPNAPLMVGGTAGLTLSDGATVVKSNPHLCRCRGARNKPY